MNVAAALREYREVREELEAAVLPLATSVDGLRFTYQTSLHGLALEAGGYVTIDGGGSRRLGQILSLELLSEDAVGLGLPQVRLRVGKGEGIVLDGDGAPFHDASVAPAPPAEVAAWLDRTRPGRATLEVGELALAPGVPVELDAGGFGRHTFLCGQSGSGKTYSLGVLLERLLLETSLRVVVLDPNSDYVRLAATRPGADSAAAERFGAIAGSVAVRSGTSGPGRVVVRFRDLTAASRRRSCSSTRSPTGRSTPSWPRSWTTTTWAASRTCAATRRRRSCSAPPTSAWTASASGPSRVRRRSRRSSTTPTAHAA